MQPGDPNELIVQFPKPLVPTINHTYGILVHIAVVIRFWMRETVPNIDGHLKGLPSLVSETNDKGLAESITGGSVDST